MISTRRAIAGIGAIALLASSAASGYAVSAPASDSETVDIVVSSTGVLSVGITESEPFDDIEYSFNDQSVQGQITIQVTDERGTAAGWNFNLRGSDFSGSVSGPGDTFPVSGLGLDHSSTTRIAGNPNISGITGYDITSVSTTGQQVASASLGSGNGQYDLLYQGELDIPGDTLVDTYTSTITVEVASAPN